MPIPKHPTHHKHAGQPLRSLALVATLLLTVLGLGAADIDLVWPTPMPVLGGGVGPLDCYQATASGEPESGGFGCVRSGGHKFHEGIDIRPMQRDRKGEPTDTIVAAMNGVVRHINGLAGESSYGRYMVIEHPDQTPAVYTLYAHLSKIAPGLRRGDRVSKGQAIATMGHTAGGYSIPRDRAHLHFEIGLCITNDFQSWYNWRKFGSPNQHEVWNGMNLLGIDAWDCISQWRAGRVRSFADQFRRLPAAVRIRIATTRTPDFIQRYPELLSGERPAGMLGGWEVSFSPTGMPFRWTPLAPLEVASLRNGQPEVTWTDDALLRQERCRDLIDVRRGRKVPGKDLNAVMELLFKLR
jgi:murein DD-endopeptidase MepM/ murein hydrolase activator NlpD